MAGLTHNCASQNTECCLRRWFFHQVGSDTANYSHLAGRRLPAEELRNTHCVDASGMFCLSFAYWQNRNQP